MHKKIGEDRASGSEDMIADRQTHTHRHAHHNTPSRIVLKTLGSQLLLAGGRVAQSGDRQ